MVASVCVQKSSPFRTTYGSCTWLPLACTAPRPCVASLAGLSSSRPVPPKIPQRPHSACWPLSRWAQGRSLSPRCSNTAGASPISAAASTSVVTVTSPASSVPDSEAASASGKSSALWSQRCAPHARTCGLSLHRWCGLDALMADYDAETGAVMPLLTHNGLAKHVRV